MKVIEKYHQHFGKLPIIHVSAIARNGLFSFNIVTFDEKYQQLYGRYHGKSLKAVIIERHGKEAAEVLQRLFRCHTVGDVEAKY